MSIDTRQQWSNYWRQGHLTSLPCGFAANYDGEFLEFWNEQFALLGPGDCVLDVCSGNGSIALLARDYSLRKGLNFAVKAADAADIDVAALIEKNPNLARHIRAIEFMPNTLLEDLPGRPASADMVTSQYGIEYTDWKLSAAKISRLLKPGGYFSFICHSFDSTIMTQMERQQRDYARLVNLPIFSRGVELGGSQGFAGNFVKQLDDALDTIYLMFKEHRTSDVLSEVGREMEKIHRLALKDFQVGFQRFAQFRQGVNISYATSSDLLAVNRRLRELPDWYKVFIDEGLELLRSGDVHYRTGEKAGKFYQLKKPA